MSRHFVPLCLTTKNFTTSEIENRKSFEQESIDKAIKLAEKTGEQDIQYNIFRFQFWHAWTEDHFPLIKEYSNVLNEYEKTLAEMVHYPLAYQDPDYKKQVKTIEADIKLVQKGLGLTDSIRTLAEQYEEVLDNE